MNAAQTRSFSMRPLPLLIIAALLAAMSLGGLLLGEFGSAGGGGRGLRSAVSGAFDLLAMPIQMTLAYGFLVLLLLLALYFVYRALAGGPALTISPDGVALHTMFGTKSIRWDEVENVSQAPPYVTISGRCKTIMVSTNVLSAPKEEVVAAIREAHQRALAVRPA